jgi:thiol-disulfide isomerase/thioredoxin
MLRAAIMSGLLSTMSGVAIAVDKDQPAPDFSGEDLRDGRPIHQVDFSGKVLLVDFWASWCSPCRQAMPRYEALRKEFASQGFEVIAVNVDQHPKEGLKALQSTQVSFPVVDDSEGSVASAYDLKVMPTSFLVDRHGVVRRINRGFHVAEVEDLRQAIAALVAKK